VLLVAGIAVSAQREARPSTPLGQPLLDPNGFPRDEASIRTPLFRKRRQDLHTLN
jgi:hypothetical protein